MFHLDIHMFISTMYVLISNYFSSHSYHSTLHKTTYVRLIERIRLYYITNNYSHSCIIDHVKLEIRSFVMNFNSGGFSLRVLYCVVDTGYWVIADLHWQKVKSSKWLKYKQRATIGGQKFEQIDGRSGFPFSLRFPGDGWICHAGLWGFSEAL